MCTLTRLSLEKWKDHSGRRRLSQIAAFEAGKREVMSGNKKGIKTWHLPLHSDENKPYYFYWRGVMIVSAFLNTETRCSVNKTFSPFSHRVEDTCKYKEEERGKKKQKTKCILSHCSQTVTVCKQAHPKSDDTDYGHLLEQLCSPSNSIKRININLYCATSFIFRAHFSVFIHLHLFMKDLSVF